MNLTKSQKHEYKLIKAVKTANLSDITARSIPMSTVTALQSKGLVRKLQDGTYIAINTSLVI